MRYTQDLAARNATGRDNIRLFKILNRRSERGQTMRCEVRMFSLKQTPNYAALSYCWRTEEIRESIQFQGSLQGTKMISRDLMSALLAAHSQFRNVWLWVDAICIDQSRTAEKNDQVPRMQNIYEGAERVLVWLGEGVPHNIKDDGWGPDEAAYHRTLGLTRGKILQLCDDSVAGRAWWSRIWVVQEMMVARQLYVFVGSHLLRWDKFVQATIDWEQYDKLKEFDLVETSRRIYQLDELRKRWWKAKHNLDLLELLDIGRQSHATDARDNIYGLLGLMKTEDRERIRVEYNSRTDLVYAEMTAMLIERQQSLNFLVQTFSYKSSQSQPNLPSWVLDFGDCQRDSYFSDVRDFMPSEFAEMSDAKIRHQASANARTSVCFHALSLKLDLEAIVFDSVVASTITIPGLWASYAQSEPEKIESGRAWIRSAVKVLEASLQTKPLPSDPRSSVFHIYDIKRLLLDFFSSDPTSIPSFRTHMDRGDDAWENKYQVEGSAESNRLPVWFDVVTSNNGTTGKITEFCQHHTLFTTTTGFAGVAEYDKRSRSLQGDTKENQSACPGDVIAIPLGSKKPWILRKTEADGEYRLIVDCIIPEIRSGEVMKLVEAKQMETQKLTLV